MEAEPLDDASLVATATAVDDSSPPEAIAVVSAVPLAPAQAAHPSAAGLSIATAGMSWEHGGDFEVDDSNGGALTGEDFGHDLMPLATSEVAHNPMAAAAHAGGTALVLPLQDGSVLDGSPNDRTKKHAWTSDEDAMLTRVVQEQGAGRWTKVAAFLPGRMGKQCRERWFNHLAPEVKKGEWTAEEDRLIMDSVREHGTKWSTIVKLLPGRSDNAIKNRYYSAVRKAQRKDHLGQAADAAARQDMSAAERGVELRHMPAEEAPAAAMMPGLPLVADGAATAYPALVAVAEPAGGEGDLRGAAATQVAAAAAAAQVAASAAAAAAAAPVPPKRRKKTAAAAAAAINAGPAGPAAVGYPAAGVPAAVTVGTGELGSPDQPPSPDPLAAAAIAAAAAAANAAVTAAAAVSAAYPSEQLPAAVAALAAGAPVDTADAAADAVAADAPPLAAAMIEG